MNDQVEIEQPAQPTELAVAVQKVSEELAGFDKIAAGLAALQAEHPADLVLDVSKSEGMKAAIKSRAAWREPRIAIEKVRKAAKAPVLDLGRKIDTFAESLTAQLRIGEEHYDAQIQVELTRKAEEKRRTDEAEARRVLDIRSRISQAFECAPGRVFGRPSAAIREELQAVVAVPIDEAAFAEFVEQASKAQASALVDLRTMLASQEAIEAHAERLRKEREEHERQVAELKRERAEYEALQAQARQAQEAAERDAMDQRRKVEAEQRAERDRIAEAQKKLDDDRRAAEEAKAAEARRIADEAAAAERKRLDDEAAARRRREEEERAAQIAQATAERIAREEAEAKEAAKRARAARKLAAAQKAGPRLLAALKPIVEAMWDGDPKRQADDPLCIEARAAIAEAEAA